MLFGTNQPQLGRPNETVEIGTEESDSCLKQLVEDISGSKIVWICTM